MEIYFDGTLIDSDNYISFTNEFKQFDESFMLGTTASNTITIEVPGNISIPTNVLIKINNSNYSTMIVDSYEYEDNNILKLNLVDKMVLLDFNYNAKSLVPCTVKQILQDICTQAGITLATTTFTNQNLSVDYYDNTITAREYVGMIAELNGGFARINTSGALELVKFTGTPTNIDIDTCEDFRVGEKHKIERVVFDNGLLKFETSSDETKETLYLNSQNVYINDETTFNNIANQILNFEFYCFSTGNCEIKSNVRAGDLINFTDGTNNYQTIAQYSLNYVGGLNGGYELNINSKKQEETKIVGVGEQYKRLSVKIDRDKNEILETVESQISGVEKEINPTDTSSNSSIYLEDSAEAELVNFELEGKTEQETRSGKNLLNATKYSSTNYISQLLTLKATTYTVNYAGDNSDGIYIRKADGTVPINGTTVAVAYNKHQFTFTLSEAGNYYIQFYKSGDGFSSFSNAQLEEGSVATEYEEYGAMPSPDYPSELVSVGYENLYEGSQNWDGNWINNGSWPIDNDTYNGLVVRKRSGSWYGIYKTFSIKKGETYTFSVYAKADEARTAGIYLTNAVSPTNVIINLTTEWKKYSVTFTARTSADVDDLRPRLENTTNSETNFTYICGYQLTKGTTQPSYIPHGKYGIEHKTTRKNLLNYETMNYGYVRDTGTIATSHPYGEMYSEFIKVEPNTQYTFSIFKTSSTFDNWIGIGQYSSNDFNSFIVRVADYNVSHTTFTFKTRENTTFVIVSARNMENVNEVQFEQSPIATSYEPYQEKTYLYTLDNPLRSIGDTKDLLYIKNGMLYVERYIRHLELPIANMNNSDAYPGWNNQTQLKIDYPSQNADFYSLTKWINNINGSKWGLGINTNGNGTLWLYTSAFHLTQTQWKEQYPDLVFKLDYILPEPYTEELGEVQIPSTYKGITYLNTTDELEPNMNITYVRDTTLSNYVENQLKSTQIIETRHYSELKLTDESITNRVTSVETNTGTLQSRMDAAETKLDDQSYTIGILGTNIDDDGNITAVRVKEGFTFDENGFQIYTDDNSFKTKIDETGTFYYDGDAIVGQYTKDGSKQKDLELFGVYYYGKSEINQDAMFVAQLYTDENGEECFGHFYNRGD